MKISLCIYRNNEAPSGADCPGGAADEPEKLGVQIESEYPTYVLTMEGDIIHPRIVTSQSTIFTHNPHPTGSVPNYGLRKGSPRTT